MVSIQAGAVFDNLVVNAMDLGGKALVSELSATAADDDIAIGSVADRCLLSGAKQTSRRKAATSVFDPDATSDDPAGFA